jgi:hypothetical protein
MTRNERVYSDYDVKRSKLRTGKSGSKLRTHSGSGIAIE